MKSFDALLQGLEKAEKKVLAVVAADEHAIEAAIEGEKKNLVDAIFIGNEQEIKDILEKLGEKEEHEIIHAETLEEAAKKGVRLVGEGRAHMILKGHIDTAILLRAVLNKEYGIPQADVLSHIAVIDSPTYHKLFIVTDGGMIPYPTLEQKKAICEAAVDAMHKLGVEEPKVACLAAVEKPSEKLKETMDAKALKDMNESGELKGCIIEGPISFDLAYDPEAAALKDYKSPVAGDADIFLVPDFVCGNLLAKSFTYAAKAKMAGLILGAKAPILLTSRSSTAEEKFLSLALAAALETGK